MVVGVDTASSGLAPDSYFRMQVAGQYEQTLQTQVVDNHFGSSKDEELSPTGIKCFDGNTKEKAFSSITQDVANYNSNNSPIPNSP